MSSKRKNKLQKKIESENRRFFMVFALAGLIMIGYGCWELSKRWAAQANGVETTAKVIREMSEDDLAYDEDGNASDVTTHYIIIQFMTTEKGQYSHKMKGTENIGEVLDIVYDPSDPHRLYRAKSLKYNLWQWFFIALGSLLLLSLPAYFLFWKESMLTYFLNKQLAKKG